MSKNRVIIEEISEEAITFLSKAKLDAQSIVAIEFYGALELIGKIVWCKHDEGDIYKYGMRWHADPSLQKKIGIVIHKIQDTDLTIGGFSEARFAFVRAILAISNFSNPGDNPAHE